MIHPFLMSSSTLPGYQVTKPVAELQTDGGKALFATGGVI